VTLERAQARWVLRLEGECSIAAAPRLRGLLREALGAAPELVVDLEAVTEIDAAVLQLLWSAEREAARENRKFGSRVPQTLEQVARDAGFERFPGATGPGAAVPGVPAGAVRADRAEG
jgi:anti-anti-sigma regulatory factor